MIQMNQDDVIGWINLFSNKKNDKNIHTVLHITQQRTVFSSTVHI